MWKKIDRFVGDIEDYNLEHLHSGPTLNDIVDVEYIETITRRLDQAQQRWCMQGEGSHFQLWRSYS